MSYMDGSNSYCFPGLSFQIALSPDMETMTIPAGLVEFLEGNAQKTPRLGVTTLDRYGLVGLAELDITQVSCLP